MYFLNLSYPPGYYCSPRGRVQQHCSLDEPIFGLLSWGADVTEDAGHAERDSNTLSTSEGADLDG